MPTRHISFLHLGDVHFPDLLAAKPLADHKDKGMSAAMAGVVSSTRIVEIGREITRIQKEQVNLVAIALTGDLTTRGDVPGYESCLRFLHKALQLSDRTYWKERRLFVVPGNHDINRSEIVNGQPLQKKFEPLLRQWEDIFGARDYLTIGSPSPTDLPISAPGGAEPSIRFLPLNTCYLCGEYRAFPAQIRDKVVELLDELKKTVAADEFERMMSEQVDCPAVSREHVDELGGHIRRNNIDSISVVLGHHPLFAQPMPRIDGYNELLNAGYIRETVLNAKRNVVYLHGHIHQDPLLSISSPLRGPHRIVHISAPALEDGFNLIKVFFSDVTNQPISLELTQYRFGDSFGLIAREPIKIRLVDQNALWSEIDDPLTKHVIGKLKAPDLAMRFSELLRSVPKSLSTNLDDTQKSEALKKVLLVLELLELIEITNRDGAAVTWQCRRKSI